MNKFQERIKELRQESGVTRAQLAEMLQVSVRLISYWENGERECSFDMLIRIAEFFQTTTDYLLGVTDLY